MKRRSFLVQVGLVTIGYGCWPTLAAAQTAAEMQAKLVISATRAQLGVDPPVLTAVALSRDGQTVATAGDDHAVRLWKAADGSMLRLLGSHSDWIRDLEFNPVDDTLATASADRSVKIWSLATGSEVRTMQTGEHPAFCLAYTPDGKTLVVGGYESQIRMFDASTGQLQRELATGDTEVRALVISPDGKLLASAGRDGRIRLWSMGDYTKSARDRSSSPAHPRLGVLARRAAAGLGRRRSPVADLERGRRQGGHDAGQPLGQDPLARLLR